MSVLSPIPDFASEDGFLHAFLGLVAASREARALLDTSPDGRGGSGAPESSDDDAILYALLGLARSSGLIDRVAESWATGDAEPEAPPPEPPARVEGLLR